MKKDRFTIEKKCLNCGTVFWTRRKKQLFHSYECSYTYRNNMYPIKNAEQILHGKEINLNDEVMRKYIDYPDLLPIDANILRPQGLNLDVYNNMIRIDPFTYETVFLKYSIHTNIKNRNLIIKIIKN